MGLRKTEKQNLMEMNYGGQIENTKEFPTFFCSYYRQHEVEM